MAKKTKMTKMGKKPSGFLKRSKSITGKIYIKPSIKPQNTRKIIRRFHLLLNKRNIIYKKLSDALGQSVNDSNISTHIKANKENIKPTDKELLGVSNEKSLPNLYVILRKIEYEIEKSGGLAKYQIASLYGQETNRGSDSSKWLFNNIPELMKYKGKIKALEIGCLSTQNIISKYAKTDRIDLNSNEPGILKQDFMERPIPKDDSDRYNLISCSLVLNFVPTPTGRGEMMQRFEQFLIKEHDISMVFIVLPLSCLTNSRYCDKLHYTKMAESLGYEIINYHEAKKLVYLVLKWIGKPYKKVKFAKKKIHDGPKMNNFSIIIE